MRIKCGAKISVCTRSSEMVSCHFLSGITLTIPLRCPQTLIRSIYASKSSNSASVGRKTVTPRVAGGSFSESRNSSGLALRVAAVAEGLLASSEVPELGGKGNWTVVLGPFALEDKFGGQCTRDAREADVGECGSVVEGCAVRRERQRGPAAQRHLSSPRPRRGSLISFFNQC
jgi:hypothetical protein